MFHVEIHHEVLGWRKVSFTESKTKGYCDGYVDACDSWYPSNPMRIVRVDKDGTKVVRETKGRGEVHTN